MRRQLIAWTLLASACAVGCGHAASKAVPPSVARNAQSVVTAKAAPSAADSRRAEAAGDDDERSQLAATRVAAGALPGELSTDSPPRRATPLPLSTSRRITGPAPVERPQVEPVPFRIADLPTVVLAPPLAAGAAVPSMLPTEPASELAVAPNTATAYAGFGPLDRSMMVQIRNAQLAQIRVGPWVGWSGGVYGASGGAYVRCGKGGGIAPWLPARWEALSVRADGAEYTVADGWFDRAACRAATSGRTAVSARPIGRGAVVFATRVCESAACERPALMLLMPRAQSVVASGIGGDATKETGAFTRVTLPLRRGGGGSAMARVATPDLLAWQNPQAPGAPVDQASSMGSSFAASMLIGVEVVQGVDDAEPLAVVYLQPRN